VGGWAEVMIMRYALREMVLCVMNRVQSDTDRLPHMMHILVESVRAWLALLRGGHALSISSLEIPC
jgi:hypothetical protein